MDTKSVDCLARLDGFRNTSYWQPFLKELRKETDKRMGELRTAAEALVAASQEAEKPYQAALEHLDALQKEVSQ